jgi:hypothetical protein
VERLLGGRYRQPARGDRADHIPPLYAGPGRGADPRRKQANRLGKPIERRIFPEGKDGIGKDGGVAYEDMRWSKLKNKDPGTMFTIVSEHVFPFLRNMAEAGTAHATHMKGARFTIPTPALPRLRTKLFERCWLRSIGWTAS